MILGTVAYMSPEQARGLPVDKRTDIWAFGCVLYEMLTGRQAFAGEGVSDTVAAVLTREPDWSALPPSIPPHLRRLLQRCLQKDPRQRLRDIGDARTDLIPEDADDATESAVQPASRLPWIAAALAMLVAIVAVAWGVRSLGADVGRTAPVFSRMTAITRGAAHEFGPVVSPDGTWVAYVSDVGGRPDVWLKFLGGSEAVNLTAASGLDISASPAIGGLEVAPDGKRIAVQAKPLGSTSPFATWEIPAPLPGVARQLLDDGFLGMRWSPDGNRMAFIRAGSTAGDAIWVADGDGTNRRELVAATGGVHMHWLTWGGNGLIYFMRPITTGFNLDQTEIYRVDVAGGAPQPVVSTLRRAMFPLFDPSGALIYAADTTGTDVGLWWKPPGSDAARRITFGLGDYMEPRVSADGRAIVATRYDNRQLLVRIDATRAQFGRVTPLTDGYGGDLDPSLARAGRLVFSSTRDGNRHLWTADPDGRNVRPLTSGPAQDYRPAMSPDGTTVAFISDRGGQRGIWLIAASGGAPRKLVDAAPVSGLDWSRSGTEIVYAAAAGAWPGLWSVSIADGTSRRISTPNVPGEPRWSPTRDIIAYLETATTGPAFIGLAFVTPDGAPQYVDQARAPNISTGFSNGMLAWSPDGRRLVVTSQTTNAVTSVWIAEPGSPTPFRKLLDLPVGPRIRGLTWTQDGTAIIVGQYDASGDIVFLERERLVPTE
jgi:Tol biopolymer transport system component